MSRGSLQRQSVDLPAGLLETSEREFLIRFVEQRRTPQELEDLVIVAGRGGAEVRLGDVARVHDLFEYAEDKVLLDGQRAALVRIEKTKNQDMIRVADAVKQFVSEERQRNPGVAIRVTQDTSTLVVDRLQMLLRNGWQGIILVFLTLWLFFSFRLSFWVVLSVPVSFLGAFFFMTQGGLTINMITMVAMLLALGLLMDDGIVIAENIAIAPQPWCRADAGRHRWRVAGAGRRVLVVPDDGVRAGTARHAGRRPGQDSPRGADRADPGAGDQPGRSLPDPAGAPGAFAAHRAARSNWFRQRFDGLLESVRERVVGPAVDIALRWRYLFIGCVVGLFLISMSLMAGGVVKFQAFPELDGDVVVARVLLPPGAPLHRTEKVVEQITGAIRRVNEHFAPRQPEGQDLVRTVVAQFNENADAFENGPHVATVTVDLLEAEVRDATIDEILEAWRTESGELTGVLDVVFDEPSYRTGRAGDRNADPRQRPCSN